MIACCSRSLPPFRLDRALKLTSSYVVSRPVNNFLYDYHGVSCNWTMDKKDSQSSAEQKKKQKKKSTLHGDQNLLKLLVSRSEGNTKVQEVHGNLIGHASIAGKDIAEAEIDVAESVISSSSPGVGADIEPAFYSKKHSISIEAVESPSLDYSHFVSLPLAIHPGLVDKLFNFQNCILGMSNSSADEIVDKDSSEDNSKGEESEPELRDVAVKLEVADGKEQVKDDITSIPIVSYPPKATSSSSLSDFGIDKSIFIKPKTFHLTVLMLKLWNKDRVAAAAEVLQNISSKVRDALDNRPIFIRLKGLDCMRGSAANASVLYAPVEEVGNEGRLLRACQVIIDAYTEAGLVLEKDAKRKLKLHATVMNVRHRKSKVRTRRVDSFDARGIFKQYGSEEWGDYLLREAHLSQRFAFDENGYYHCCASIPFPESMQLD